MDEREWEMYEDWDEGSDDYYDVDPEEEEREIRAREDVYENWLGRT